MITRYLPALLALALLTPANGHLHAQSATAPEAPAAEDNSRAIRKAKGRKKNDNKQEKRPDTSAQPSAPVLPAMPRAVIKAGLKSHDRALYIKQGWIRDPYLKLGPYDYYYLTGTTPSPGDPREQSDPYNIGLGPSSIVGSTVQVWRSRDLID